jgi:hypothetical protein
MVTFLRKGHCFERTSSGQEEGPRGVRRSNMATPSLTPAGHGPDSPQPILRDWLVEPRVPPLLQPRQACRQFGQQLLLVLQFSEHHRSPSKEHASPQACRKRANVLQRQAPSRVMGGAVAGQPCTAGVDSPTRRPRQRRPSLTHVAVAASRPDCEIMRWNRPIPPLGPYQHILFVEGCSAPGVVCPVTAGPCCPSRP